MIHCEKEGGTLVSIPDEETQKFLKSNISSGENFWTGGTPCCEGIWRWLDGTPWSYTDWRSGYPEDGIDQRLYFKDGWVTYPLTERKACICQYQYAPDDE